MIARLRPHLLPAALLLLSVGFSALALAAELQSLPTINDGNNHFLFVRRAEEALTRGEHVLDHWVPQMELGFPEFFYYQHLPHLVVVALGRLTFGLVDLFTLFNLVRFLLLVTFPLTVFWSMRVMGFRPMAAAFGGAASPLLSGAFNFGLEYDSYVWIGYGMYTQLWASHLVVVTIALLHRALEWRRGYSVAIAAFAALALTHLAYAYMAALTAIVLALLVRSPRAAGGRLAAVALVGAATAVVTSYMTLPFVLERQYLEISPSLPRFRWDSYGAQQVLTWLVQGRLFDAGRLPVLTVLVAVGAGAAVLRRSRPGLVALALFVVWLVLYFGRATLGPIADLLPFREGVPMHRFIAMVQLAGILLIGFAGGTLVEVFARAHRAGPIAATLVLALLLGPALSERATFFASNAELMDRARKALARDVDARRILDELSASPPGRVYAGLRTNWGERMLNLGLSFNSLRFYDLLTFEDLWPIAPPYYSWSLNSDIMFFFNDSDPGHFDAFGVNRAITPWDVRLTVPATRISAVGPYALWEIPGTGLARFVALEERVGVPTQAELIERNVRWLRSDGPATGRYIRYDFPAPAATRPIAAGGCPSGSVVARGVGPASFDLTTECPVAATLVLKTTYHPNWRVLVDGVSTPTFMVSPSYIGLEVPAGTHRVSAEYLAHPLKSPLALAGLFVLGAILILRRRVDALVGRFGQPAPDRDQPTGHTIR